MLDSATSARCRRRPGRQRANASTILRIESLIAPREACRRVRGRQLIQQSAAYRIQDRGRPVGVLDHLEGCAHDSYYDLDNKIRQEAKAAPEGITECFMIN